ncbi:hypothetical protein SmJEL517_g01207 [Synchytrium microbalum]|uniref:DUF1003 domain-containing protein n=1 Tax=Synchytrium microbalum TaxID=1806994 RepID=A0A507CGQ4_9FUNG|nr:uncharacterized protein SmJEL517_g01207 [Synchytrium microbalum]TPX36703.1 hypothetical protein SmJEL517_g01207 [Synchytrium microbalum]
MSSRSTSTPTSDVPLNDIPPKKVVTILNPADKQSKVPNGNGIQQPTNDTPDTEHELDSGTDTDDGGDEETIGLLKYDGMNDDVEPPPEESVPKGTKEGSTIKPKKEAKFAKILSTMSTDTNVSSVIGVGSNTGVCVVCGNPLPKPVETQTLLVKNIKPRILRQLRLMSPHKTFSSHSRVCIRDLNLGMQARIEQLLAEDQNQLAALQDNAVRNLTEHELLEETWQHQFDKKRTMGQKAADSVAKRGGSWYFISGLLAFLATWAAINLILAAVGSSPWDPYPFILLNLFLSMLAALQAPIIMMSQNRQAARDRIQNDYVSRMTLRAENNVRHVNAKTDHFLGHQWKRLLEIQEIKIELLQTLQHQHKRYVQRGVRSGYSLVSEPGLPGPKAETWSAETQPDAHALMLLKHQFGLEMYPEPILFSHWSGEGDNYHGQLTNSRAAYSSGARIKRIVYDLEFDESMMATLDDIFSGEGSVSLRNDFDMPHMYLGGRILALEIHSKDGSVVSHTNGDMPTRYKPSFAPRRRDKIADFWKTPITRVTITYSPPWQVAVLVLKPGQIMESLDANFFPPHHLSANKELITTPTTGAAAGRSSPSGDSTSAPPATPYLYMYSEVSSESTTPDPEKYLKAILGPRPLPASWKQVATCDFVTPGSSELHSASSEYLPISMSLEVNLHGPGVFVFYCQETRVSLHGHIENAS